VIEVYIGYVNARIRGMKSRLFDQKSLENLMMKPDLDSVITALEKSSYKEDIEKASVQHSGIQLVEEALRSNLSWTCRLILGIVRDERYEKHIKILLNKWDIHNIKTIIRGKNIHVPPDEILENLVPAGELDAVTLIELVKQTDVRGVIDLLATWNFDYARPLTRKFQKYLEKKDLAILEYALDKYYYQNALNTVNGKSYNDRIVRDIIRTEIDTVNIKSILKAIRDGIPIEDAQSLLIDGGKELDTERLISLLKTRTVEAVIQELAATPYGFLADIPHDRFKGAQISVYEKELDRYLTKRGIEASRGDPLSIALPVGFLWLKNTEITNIRIISRCKAAYIPVEEVKEALIYV
jgi:V/A-type H+-transporting ATPase subunit C